jgi:hypothetical protein
MTEFGRRRTEIMAFLGGLSEREKLIVLTYLSNDAAINARIAPELASTVLDMRRSLHRAELLKLAADNSNVDLQLLARRKGCRLEQRPGDRWHIASCSNRNAGLGIAVARPQQALLTRRQALDVLRSLPDRQQRSER